MNDAIHSHDEISLDGAIAADAVIVGAGPCGLFQVFELGLLGIHAHLIDSLPKPGGQCTELYPDKPIYDIPALPVCGAQELIDRLLEQIRPFKPDFHLGEEVTEVRALPDHTFFVRTSADTRFQAKAVIVAGGLGSFQPRRLGVEGADAFEGSRIHYKVRNARELHDQRLVLFGGGDSALDWAIDLCTKARSLTLVHRRPEFRGAPASAEKMKAFAAAGKLEWIEAVPHGVLQDNGAFKGVVVKQPDNTLRSIECDQVLTFFGLHPRLGPIANWGLAVDKRAVAVDTEKFQTNVPGIFAVGDINTYPGKKKLILSGFHEAALAAFAVAERLNPAKKVHLQYTTTSPLMKKRLGVEGGTPS